MHDHTASQNQVPLPSVPFESDQRDLEVFCDRGHDPPQRCLLIRQMIGQQLVDQGFINGPFVRGRQVSELQQGMS